MLKSLNLARRFRMLATGICFLTFICCSFLLTITALPLMLLSSSTQTKLETRALRLIQLCFKTFIRYMILLSPVKSFNVEDLETIKSLGGCIFIANHPSLIDVIGAISCLPLCHCIVKKSLLEHIYLGSLMRVAGYIANDQATQLVEDCNRSLQAGHSLLIFPEGTRSPAHSLRPFNRGAAQIALRTGAPIVPIIITCDPPTLLKGEPWYVVPERRFTLTLRFHSPLTIPASVMDKASFPLQVRALNHYFEDFFHHHLQELDPQHAAPHSKQT